MSERLFMTVIIYVKPGEMVAFRAYEDQAMPLMADHGGRVEQMIVPQTINTDMPLPDEIHLLSFDSAEGFTNYRNDPRTIALAPLREQSIEHVIFITGHSLMEQGDTP